MFKNKTASLKSKFGLKNQGAMREAAEASAGNCHPKNNEYGVAGR
jgi:hypothetical protein